MTGERATGRPGRHGLRHGPAKIEAKQAQRSAEQERHAPAPVRGGRPAERGRDDGAHRGAQQHAADRAEAAPTAEEAAAPGPGLLDQEDDRRRILAADRESLGEAQQDEEHRGEDADPVVGRHDPDQEGRHRHREDRTDERRFASDAVPDMAEHQAPERTHEKAGGEGAEGGNERGHAVPAGKELAAQDRGELPIHREVVPLEDIADDPSQDHVARARHGRFHSYALVGRGPDWDKAHLACPHSADPLSPPPS
jgi:hypothetical protein